MGFERGLALGVPGSSAGLMDSAGFGKGDRKITRRIYNRSWIVVSLIPRSSCGSSRGDSAFSVCRSGPLTVGT